MSTIDSLAGVCRILADEVERLRFENARLAHGRPHIMPSDEPQSGNMDNWPYGKIILFDISGKPLSSYSPELYRVGAKDPTNWPATNL